MDSIKKKVMKYYEEYFDISALLDIIGDTPFDSREFAFETFIPTSKKRFVWNRNLSFNTPEDLIDYLSHNPMRKVYFGALYDGPLSGSVSDAHWISTTLKFDIDVDQSNLIREYTCDCVKKTREIYEEKGVKPKIICNKCIKIAAEAVLFLIDTLENDFGLTNPRIFFSGSRGFHVHYPRVHRLHSYKSMRLEEKVRRSLIYYLTAIQEEEDDEKNTFPIVVRGFDALSHPMKKRIERMIVPSYLKNAPIDHLKTLHWKKYVTRKSRGNDKLFPKNVPKSELDSWVIGLKEIGSKCDAFTREFAEENRIHYEQTIENAMIYRYPRYDGSPTIDLKKVIKIPNSIDASTGYIVQEFKRKDLIAFDLGKVKTIDDFVP